MNHIEHLHKLNNRYFALRHGEAESNVKNIIVCERSNGVSGYGLTDKGRNEVRESLRSLSPAGEYVIVASDFLRTKETAEIANDYLHAEALYLDPRLEERNFGELEGKPATFYDVVWENDQTDPEKTIKGIEPANHLMERVTAVVSDMENRYIGKSIVIVSHGDPLQFLETAFAKIPITEHQKYPLLDTGQIKELILAE